MSELNKSTIFGEEGTDTFKFGACISRPKNMAASDPSVVTQETPEDPPDIVVAEDRLIKNVIK